MIDTRALPRPLEDDAARCRLLRADGTEWRVTGLRQAEQGLEVDAIHLGLSPAGDGGPGRSVPSLHLLEGEPLGRGDLIQWVGDGGEVLWSMAAPARPLRA